MRGGVRLSGLFQFHKGTIRTKAEAYHGEGSGDFNSIKVRLEQPNDKDENSIFIFQFHKGTSRTQCQRESRRQTPISIP